MRAEVVRPPSGGFPRHSHDEYVVSVGVAGIESVRLDSTSFEAGADDVTVYNPGQVQSCTTRTAPGTAWACVSLYVSAAEMAALAGETVEFRRPVVRSPRLRAALLASAAGRAAADDVLVELLAAVDTGPRTAAPPPSDPRVAAVLDRLRSDLSAAPDVASIAAEVGLTREHLIRTFTRATGSPPYAWHLQARLAEGRRRLRRGTPVADVAHALGFADQAHFHKHFRAAYAMTPGRYRRAHARIRI